MAYIAHTVKMQVSQLAAKARADGVDQHNVSLLTSGQFGFGIGTGIQKTCEGR